MIDILVQVIEKPDPRLRLHPLPLLEALVTLWQRANLEVDDVPHMVMPEKHLHFRCPYSTVAGAGRFSEVLDAEIIGAQGGDVVGAEIVQLLHAGGEGRIGFVGFRARGLDSPSTCVRGCSIVVIVVRVEGLVREPFLPSSVSDM